MTQKNCMKCASCPFFFWYNLLYNFSANEPGTAFAITGQKVIQDTDIFKKQHYGHWHATSEGFSPSEKLGLEVFPGSKQTDYNKDVYFLSGC